MLRQKVRNRETDRYISGRSKERDNSISKYLINEKSKTEKTKKKRLNWNESKRNEKVYLTLLEEQLIQTNSNILKENITTTRKNQKALITNKEYFKEDKMIFSLNNPEEIYFKKSKINKEPFKVLDAPSFKDDFYLHLLDWSLKDYLAVGLGKEVYLWDAVKSTSNLLHSIDNYSYISSVKWLNEGTSLLIGTSTGKIILWDIVEKKVIHEYFFHTKRVGVLTIKDENFFSSGSQDNTIINYDVRLKENVNLFEGHNQEVCGLKWSYDGNYLASGGNDNKVFIWSQQKSYYLKKFSQHKSAVKAIDWSPHKLGLLATGGGTQDRSIKFWNISNFSLLDSIDTNSQVCNIKFDQFSDKIITTHGFSDNLTVIWKYPGLEISEILKGHRERVIYFAYCPKGTSIATGAGDETIRLWNINNQTKNIKKDIDENLQFLVKIR